MTEETAEIQRLDYSESPPGYQRRVLGSMPLAHATVPLRESIRRGADFEWFATEAEGRADAWSRYKAHNDPPGMSVVPRTLRQGSVEQQVWCFTPAVDVAPEWSWSVEEAEARAAAWAWYDRRLTLLAKLELAEVVTRQFIADDFWPAAMTWSEEQVAEVERWLVDSTAELPAVLDDDGPHICTGCIGDGPCDALETEIEAEERNADEVAELEAEIDADDEFMDDGLCSPMPQREGVARG